MPLQVERFGGTDHIKSKRDIDQKDQTFFRLLVASEMPNVSASSKTQQMIEAGRRSFMRLYGDVPHVYSDKTRTNDGHTSRGERAMKMLVQRALEENDKINQTDVSPQRATKRKSENIST